MGEKLFIPLVKTKLFIPQVREERVRRGRLTAELDKGLQFPLILLSSLPGSGKTTLLADWISQLAIPAAWVSLDASDNEPSRFLRYFIAGVQSIFPEVGKTPLKELDSVELLSIETILTSLINDLSEQESEFVLVLDDFHLIQSRPIQSGVAYFIDRMPSQAHLVIATRTDPRFPLSRLRARNKVLEFRMDDLRFSVAEIGEYLNQVMGLDLSKDDLFALETRTEGWIASLQMTALSLKHAADPQKFIRAFSGSNRYVMDYLVEEVLDLQTEDVQNFLLQTSILERLNGSLCDAVCAGGPAGQGQEMLEFLERSNLFIIPLDEERHWYRYHHLFASLLRARLAHLKTGPISDLHRRAVDWFEQNGYPEDAIQHALAAQDFPRAADLIERIAETVWFNGQYARLTGWVRSLPEEQVLSKPWLCVWNAWSISQTGVVKDANAWIAAAEEAVQKYHPDPSDAKAVSQEFDALMVEITALKVLTACLAQDYDRAILLAAEILENPLLKGIKSSLMAQCHILHGLSYKYFTDGEMAKAEQANLETIHISKEIRFTLRQLHGANKLAYVYITTGQLQRCYRHIQDQLAYLQAQGLAGYFAAGGIRCRLVDLLYEWDQLEEARGRIEHDLRPEMVPDVPYLLVDFFNIRARNFMLENDYSAAQNALNQASAQARQSFIWNGLAWQSESIQVKLWLKKGDLAQAAAWAAGQPESSAALLPFACESRELSRARILSKAGNYGEAVRLLNRLKASAETGGRQGSLIEILTLAAIALQQNHEMAPAILTLEKALTLAEPEGYVRTFIGEGASIAELLGHIAHEHRSTNCGYARRLLARLENVIEPAARIFRKDEPGSSSNVNLIEPLSRRELQVLGCMADGLSNAETAYRLVIEVGTVKRHINSIFGKLGVNNRVQALNKAKEQKII